MVFVFGGFLILSAGSALPEQIHHHTVEYNMRDGEHDTQKKKFAED